MGEGGTVSSKNLLVFIVFLAVIFLVLVPYVQFVVQRQGLDTDVTRISLDYSTMGPGLDMSPLSELLPELEIFDATSDGQRFVLFPREGDGRRGHVTLVTRWFEELEQKLAAGR